MAFPSLAKFIDWLRAGYPSGMPQQDYVVLLGLLARRLTASEVDEVARMLASEGLIDATDAQIAQEIHDAYLTPPRQEDIDRIGTHLDAAHWTSLLEREFPDRRTTS